MPRFLLQPKVIAELDQNYHRLNVELASKPKLNKATFREAILDKGIANPAAIRDELRHEAVARIYPFN